jgi:hypothetical protein
VSEPKLETLTNVTHQNPKSDPVREVREAPSAVVPEGEDVPIHEPKPWCMASHKDMPAIPSTGAADHYLMVKSC